MVLLMGALRANRTLYTQEAVNHWLRIKWDSLGPDKREQYVVSRERITLHFLPDKGVEEEPIKERPQKIQKNHSWPDGLPSGRKGETDVFNTGQ